MAQIHDLVFQLILKINLFLISGSLSPEGEPNYTVVATDYYNYALVYSCSTFGPGNKIGK